MGQQKHNDIQEIALKHAITAPLLACNDAQIQLAGDAYDYLRQNLMRKTQKGDLTPVTVAFSFHQSGTIQTTRIPLLSLVPLPSLQINELEFNYQAQVTQCSQSTLKVKIANEEAEIRREDSLHSFFTIRLRASNADMPMGLSHLYQLLGNAISVEEKKQK